MSELDIAIIGMACRFPGANSVESFWQNIRDGVESISYFSDEELLAAGVNPEHLDDPNYVKAGTVLSQADCFDANFFGFSPHEATNLDPQHRIFLECAYQALEDAGCHPASYPGTIGIYAGSSINTYLNNNLVANPNKTLSSELYQYMIGNDKDYLPTQVSYRLNLKGPSVNVQTACSTSLVAVHIACQSILNGECSAALAGGVAVQFPQVEGYLHQQGMIFSGDGHCRTFDAKAQGTVGGCGVGVVMLKRAEDALADGDYIHALIKGTAINNDGALKVGYTAPSVDGQAKVIREAQMVAGVESTTISYVEAHGTGTTLGDPIEIAALKQAFQTEEKGYCAIGSVKTNIGHADAAAGVAGLIKTVMALKTGLIPPSLHFESPNPQIDFANSPFYVNTTLKEWNTNGFPRRAGVSAFGIGGTNAHLVLEQAPPIRTTEQIDSPQHLLCLSAKEPQALLELCQRYATHLTAHPDLSLANVCYTASSGRDHFVYRKSFVATSVAELSEKLAAYGTESQQFVPTVVSGKQKKPKITFLFTGQGAQYVHMGRELYQTQPLFRETVHRCDEQLKPHLGKSVLELLYPTEHDNEIDDNHHAMRLSQTEITQPALFVLEYALATLWQSWGITPSVVMGHSVGELVAACFAGVFSLEDALRLVAARGRLMQSLQHGEMVSVLASETRVRDTIRPHRGVLAIAAVNGPENVVISGTHEAVQTVTAQLEADGIKTRHLIVSHAFHSPMMDTILEEFRQVANTVVYTAPKITLISNLTGQSIDYMVTDDVTTADYWVRHARETVRFADGIATLLTQESQLWIEIGPKPTLLGLAQLQWCGDVVMLPSLSPKRGDWQQMLESLGELYVHGVDIDWTAFHREYQRGKLPLPTYPFQRQSYWVERSKQRTTQLVPLIDNLIQMPRQQQAIFETLFDLEAIPFLTDYRFHKVALLPPACHLSMVLNAIMLLSENAKDTTVTLKNIHFTTPLLLPRTVTPTVQLLISQLNQLPDHLLSRATFELYSLATSSVKTTHPFPVHSSGQIGIEQKRLSTQPLDKLRQRCQRQVDVAQFYQNAATQGWYFGPAFRWIQQAWLGEQEILTQFQKPTTRLSLSGYLIHPGLLDTSMQSIMMASMLMTETDLNLELKMPITITAFRCGTGKVAEKRGNSGWVHAKAVGRDEWDISLLDSRGQQIAEIKGLTIGTIAGLLNDPIEEESDVESKADFLAQLQQALPKARRRLLIQYLQTLVAAKLKLPQSPLIDKPLTDMGMNSLMSIELRNQLQTDLQVSLSATLMFEYANIKQLSDHLLQEVLDFRASPNKMETEEQDSQHQANSLDDIAQAIAPSPKTSVETIDRKDIAPLVEKSLGELENLLNNNEKM